jgi:mono/diheme cytochrome c family protein
MGIAFGPNGTMYIGDTEKGRIWSVRFTGDKSKFGKADLAKMEARKQLSHIKTPDFEKDNFSDTNISEGQQLYNKYCMACHQSDGKGASGRFPPLNKTDWVIGNKERLVHLMLNGMEGPIEVNGENYNGIMPQHSFLKDNEIAEVLSYIRTHFGNTSNSISTEEVTKYRITNSKK